MQLISGIEGVGRSRQMESSCDLGALWGENGLWLSVLGVTCSLEGITVYSLVSSPAGLFSQPFTITKITKTNWIL